MMKYTPIDYTASIRLNTWYWLHVPTMQMLGSFILRVIQ